MASFGGKPSSLSTRRARFRSSLRPKTKQVTRDLVFREKPDVIVQVADAKNLRRTLLLTIELSELQIPMVLALNMSDEARQRA